VNGGNDPPAAIAFGVGNAVFNTINHYLERLGDRKGANVFVGLFGGRTPEETDAADLMIDWITAKEGGKTPEFISTLIGRLGDVLSRPA
jgi:hypothetical protein